MKLSFEFQLRKKRLETSLQVAFFRKSFFAYFSVFCRAIFATKMMRSVYDFFCSNVSKAQACAMAGVAGVAGAALLLKMYLKLSVKKHEIDGSLQGKVVIISGGASGVGKETTKQLAKHGATVHVLAKDVRRAEYEVAEIRKKTNNPHVYVHYADLSNFITVRSFVAKFLASGSPIHVLINNAAIVNDKRKLTIDGLEETIQANHLSHFLLTNLLMDRLVRSAPSRIINVSSSAHNFVNKDVFSGKDLCFRNTRYGGFRAYCWSKMANVLFTRELARRLHGKGVTANALYPGSVRMDVTRTVSGKNPLVVVAVLASPFCRTAYEGAQTALYLATSDEVANVTGQYFVDCRPSPLGLLALDEKLASTVWWESEKLTKLAIA